MRKYFIVADKNGDVYIHSKYPVRKNKDVLFDYTELEYWYSDGDVVEVYDHDKGYTVVGRIINIPSEIVDTVRWEDDPKEIVVRTYVVLPSPDPNYDEEDDEHFEKKLGVL